MADNLRQISLTIDTDRFTATDFAGRQNPSLSVVNGDTLLLAVQFLRLNASTGALEALNLSAGGAPQALRCTVRQTRDPAADLLTFQGAYNQGDLPAAENLATGRVTWKIAFNSDNLDDLFTAGVETVDVWIELVYLSAGGTPQTLFQRQLTVAEQLDDGAVGDPPPSSPTYLTATEIAASYVGKNLYDAYSVLAADVDNTPAALALAASTVPGRKASGGIVALTGADLATIIGAHAMLSATHADATTGTCTRGDLITAQGASPTWTRLAASVPAAGLMNYLGFANGDTEPGYKALFDATVPTTIAEGASAATGTATVAARRDHTHGAPSTWAATAHPLLGAARHNDTTTGTCTRGDLIVGIGASPTWTRYAIAVPAANVRNVFGIDNGETEPTWKTALDGTNPVAVAESTAAAPGTSLVFAHRDHAHACPATWAATAHNLLSTIHGDTLADTVIAGDLLIGNATPKWARLAAGAQYYVLGMGASLPAWALLTNNNVDAAAAIARSKLAAGTAAHVVINAASTGVFSSEAQLAVSRGGTGVATAAANRFFAGPASGADAAPAFRATMRADIPTLPNDVYYYHQYYNQQDLQWPLGCGLGWGNKLYGASVTFETSPDGASWSAGANPEKVTDGIYNTYHTIAAGTWGRWTTPSLAYSGVAAIMVAINYWASATGTMKCYTSTDGSAWTERYSTTQVGGGYRYFSIDKDWPNTATFYVRIELRNTSANDAYISQILAPCMAPSGTAQGLTALPGCTMRDGLVGAPGFPFTSDLNSGIYRIGADNWGLAAGGGLIADLTTTAFRLAGGKILNVDHIAEATGSHGVVFDHVVGIPSGAVSAPGLFFSVDTDCGIYRIGENNWGMAAGGALIADMTTTAFRLAAGKILLLPDGTKTIPALGFTSNPDVGIYGSTNVMRVSINDTDTFEWAANYAMVIGTAADATTVRSLAYNKQNEAAGVGAAFTVYGIGAKTITQIRGAWEAAATTEGYLCFATRAADACNEKWRINSAGKLLANQDGTAALPVLSWIADPDSGIYRIGADNWGLAAGGGLIADVGSAGLTLANTKDILAATAGGSDLGASATGWGDIYLDTTKKVQFRDAAIYLSSKNDGYLDIDFDTGLRLNSNSDVITIAHDGTDAIFKTSDGSFKFQTDEGTDTNTYLDIRGKGTGNAYLRLYSGAGVGGDSLNVYYDGTNAHLRPTSGSIYLDESVVCSDQIAVAGDVRPVIDATYYLGKNDDDTPAAWKGVILKDTTNGKYYRVEVISGVVTATDLTD